MSRASDGWRSDWRGSGGEAGDGEGESRGGFVRAVAACLDPRGLGGELRASLEKPLWAERFELLRFSILRGGGTSFCFKLCLLHPPPLPRGGVYLLQMSAKPVSKEEGIACPFVFVDAHFVTVNRCSFPFLNYSFFKEL